MCLQPDWQKCKLALTKKCSCSGQYGKFFLIRLFSFQVGIFLSSRFVPDDYDRICFENQDKNLMQTSFLRWSPDRRLSNAMRQKSRKIIGRTCCAAEALKTFNHVFYKQLHRCKVHGLPRKDISPHALKCSHAPDGMLAPVW